MKKTEYADAPSSVKKSLETATVIADFLPPPENLVRKTQKEKITILLDTACVDFFKKQAKAQNTKYQTMINEVLLQYAEHYMA